MKIYTTRDTERGFRMGAVNVPDRIVEKMRERAERLVGPAEADLTLEKMRTDLCVRVARELLEAWVEGREAVLREVEEDLTHRGIL